MLAKREAIIHTARKSPTPTNNPEGAAGVETKSVLGFKTTSRRQEQAKYAAQLTEDFKSSADAWAGHLQRKNVQLEVEAVHTVQDFDDLFSSSPAQHSNEGAAANLGVLRASMNGPGSVDYTTAIFTSIVLDGRAVDGYVDTGASNPTIS